MNQNEKYLFDLQGYTVVKGALSAAQLDDLRSRLEDHRRANPNPILGSDRTIFRGEGDPAWSAPSLLEMGGTYIDLIDLPHIKPYLTTLMGDHYRLDHDYVKVDGRWYFQQRIYDVMQSEESNA